MNSPENNMSCPDTGHATKDQCQLSSEKITSSRSHDVRWNYSGMSRDRLEPRPRAYALILFERETYHTSCPAAVLGDARDGECPEHLLWEVRWEIGRLLRESPSWSGGKSTVRKHPNGRFASTWFERVDP